MVLITIIGSLIGLIIIYLVGIIFLPGITVRKQALPKGTSSQEIPKNRQNISFDVDGVKVKAWLYLPDHLSSPVACVILNQGFCGTKDMILEHYALRFSQAGIAAITFDYRHFGESEGEPRQLYSLTKQLSDLRMAVKFARSRSEIDEFGIFIWGTSSSGNYGIIMAGEDPEIAGIIGQSPSFDHQADGKMIVRRDGIRWFLKLIVHAQRDKGRSRSGLSEHRFPVVGKPGTTAMFIAPGAYEGYTKLAEDSRTFVNEVCARLMFDPHGPDLLQAAANVKCPALFHICEKDNIVAPESYHKVVKALSEEVEIIKNPIGHFEIYFGEYFEKSISEQISFINKNLKSSNKTQVNEQAL